eukprot:scaffold281567_cov22-Tisochrysis_lutea.AAC.1
MRRSVPYESKGSHGVTRGPPQGFECRGGNFRMLDNTHASSRGHVHMCQSEEGMKQGMQKSIQHV